MGKTKEGQKVSDYQTGLVLGAVLGWLFSSIVIVLVLALFYGASENERIPKWRARRENQRLYKAEKDCGIAPRWWKG